MSVHYKFNAAKEFDTIPVDGLHISLLDLKEAIIQHKRLGRGDVCDLQVTNAETKDVYSDDKMLIPKNSSLIIARVPIASSVKRFGGDRLRNSKEILLSSPEFRMNTEGSEEAERMSRRLEQMADLTKYQGSEEEKISAMMAQSTIDYHPTRYLKLRNTIMSGKVPKSYKCYKCHRGGHWVAQCPFNNQDLRKCTGIPTEFLEVVQDPKTPGVMITSTGQLVIFRQKALDDLKLPAHVRAKIPQAPQEFRCLLCKELMQDAVLTPCCADAFCDDCIRTHLLDSDEHECPSCLKTDVSPDQLVPNRYLRTQIVQFGSEFLTELPKITENGEGNSGTPDRLLSPSSDDSPAVTIIEPDVEQSEHIDTVEEVTEKEVVIPIDDLEEMKDEEEVPSQTEARTTEAEDSEAVKESKKKKKKREEKEKKKQKKKDKEKKKKKNKKKDGDHESDDSEDDDRSSSKSKSPSKSGGSTRSENAFNISDGLMNEALIPNYNPAMPLIAQPLIAQPIGGLPHMFNPAALLPPGFIAIRGPNPYNIPGYPEPNFGHRSASVDPLLSFNRYLAQKDAVIKYRPPAPLQRSPPAHYRNRSRSGTPPRLNAHHGREYLTNENHSSTPTRRKYSHSPPSSRYPGPGGRSPESHLRGYSRSPPSPVSRNYRDQPNHRNYDPRERIHRSTYDRPYRSDARRELDPRPRDTDERRHEEERWRRRKEDEEMRKRKYDELRRKDRYSPPPYDVKRNSEYSPRKRDKERIDDREYEDKRIRERREKDQATRKRTSEEKGRDASDRKSKTPEENDKKDKKDRDERVRSRDDKDRSRDDKDDEDIEKKKVKKSRWEKEDKKDSEEEMEVESKPKSSKVSKKEAAEEKEKKKKEKRKEKHDKKKKKKEKERKAAQSSGDEKEKKKKEKKKLKKLGASKKNIEKSPKEPKEKEKTGLSPFMPERSKWERDDDSDSSSYNTTAMKKSPLKEESGSSNTEGTITSDILKRAEMALFSKSHVKILSHKSKEKRRSRSPELPKEKLPRSTLNDIQAPESPDWLRSEDREAERKGSNILITIKSKKEEELGLKKELADPNKNGRGTPSLTDDLPLINNLKPEEKESISSEDIDKSLVKAEENSVDNLVGPLLQKPAEDLVSTNNIDIENVILSKPAENLVSTNNIVIENAIVSTSNPIIENSVAISSTVVKSEESLSDSLLDLDRYQRGKKRPSAEPEIGDTTLIKKRRTSEDIPMESASDNAEIPNLTKVNQKPTNNQVEKSPKSVNLNPTENKPVSIKLSTIESFLPKTAQIMKSPPQDHLSLITGSKKVPSPLREPSVSLSISMNAPDDSMISESLETPIPMETLSISTSVTIPISKQLSPVLEASELTPTPVVPTEIPTLATSNASTLSTLPLCTSNVSSISTIPSLYTSNIPIVMPTLSTLPNIPIMSNIPFVNNTIIPVKMLTELSYNVENDDNFVNNTIIPVKMLTELSCNVENDDKEDGEIGEWTDEEEELPSPPSRVIEEVVVKKTKELIEETKQLLEKTSAYRIQEIAENKKTKKKKSKEDAKSSSSESSSSDSEEEKKKKKKKKKKHKKEVDDSSDEEVKKKKKKKKDKKKKKKKDKKKNK